MQTTARISIDFRGGKKKGSMCNHVFPHSYHLILSSFSIDPADYITAKRVIEYPARVQFERERRQEIREGKKPWPKDEPFVPDEEVVLEMNPRHPMDTPREVSISGPPVRSQREVWPYEKQQWERLEKLNSTLQNKWRREDRIKRFGKSGLPVYGETTRALDGLISKLHGVKSEDDIIKMFAYRPFEDMYVKELSFSEVLDMYSGAVQNNTLILELIDNFVLKQEPREEEFAEAGLSNPRYTKQSDLDRTSLWIQPWRGTCYCGKNSCGRKKVVGSAGLDMNLEQLLENCFSWSPSGLLNYYDLPKPYSQFTVYRWINGRRHVVPVWRVHRHARYIPKRFSEQFPPSIEELMRDLERDKRLLEEQLHHLDDKLKELRQQEQILWYQWNASPSNQQKNVDTAKVNQRIQAEHMDYDSQKDSITEQIDRLPSSICVEKLERYLEPIQDFLQSLNIDSRTIKEYRSSPWFYTLSPNMDRVLKKEFEPLAIRIARSSSYLKKAIYTSYLTMQLANGSKYEAKSDMGFNQTRTPLEEAEYQQVVDRHRFADMVLRLPPVELVAPQRVVAVHGEQAMWATMALRANNLEGRTNAQQHLDELVNRYEIQSVVARDFAYRVTEEMHRRNSQK